MRGKNVVSLCSVALVAVLSTASVGDTVHKESAESFSNHIVASQVVLVKDMQEIEKADTSGEETVCSKNSDLELTKRESFLLRKIAMAEAEGEDTEGKALVMLVVLNRVSDASFPDTIEDVIYQDRQFSPVTNGRFDSVIPDADCRRALSLVRHGWDGSDGATYFESRSDSTWHAKNLHFLFVHGKHYFYKDREQ